MLTLHYIQDKSHRFKIYVANRATQILESTSAADRNFSEGVENPADISLRGGGGGGGLTKTCYVTLIRIEGIAWLDQHFCIKVRNSGK